MSIGVPIKLLHEAEGHQVILELKSGEIYRGRLIEAEDNMNVQMAGITRTHRDGRVTALEQAFIRGSQVRFLILPDMLQNAPMFKRTDMSRPGSGRGTGRGVAGMGGRGRGGGGRGRGR